ncbi:MAG TPA: zf-HC2 domain-containing protein [Phototrophicaceae bacterium]|nr:zf-HC2 domain-containing protein [Phototrophicaceae bacterium]
MNSPELPCKELVELVTDYLEGTLSPADHKRFEAHLHHCGGCRNYIAQMRTTIQLTGTLSEDDLSPEAEQALLDLFRDWKREQSAD